ncbi:MAG: acyltransferase [Sphingomonas paucimobilis]
MTSPRIAPAPLHRLRELDALRGLSALAVALYHYSYFIGFILPGTALPDWQVRWGDAGVKLFFAISGFAMLATLERTSGMTAFAVARARRLLPEYWLAMALTGVVAWALGPEKLRVAPLDWLANLPLLQAWTGVPMVDGVYWTLNVEILFYAWIALLWRLGATRRVDRLVLGWMTLRLACWVIPVPAWVQQLLLIDHAPWFAIGLIAWPIWRGTASVREQVPLFATVVAIAALTGDRDAALWSGGIALLFLAVTTGRMRWLAQPALLWLGGVSYAFYLLHALIGYAIIARLQAAGMSANIAPLLALSATLMLATIVTRWCEAWRARPRSPRTRYQPHLPQTARPAR